MMLLLILDVLSYPRELSFAEADNAEAALPLDPLEASRLIHFIRARPLQVANQIADADIRLDVDRQMNVRLSAAAFVEVDAANLAAAVFDEGVDLGFQLRGEQCVAVLSVPVQMKIGRGRCGWPWWSTKVAKAQTEAS